MRRITALSMLAFSVALNLATAANTPIFPRQLQDLDGVWIWEYGNVGKTAFVLKTGKIRDHDWDFELSAPPLNVNTNKKYAVDLPLRAAPVLKINQHKRFSSDLFLQPDGSWKGVRVPGGDHIVMRRVDPSTLKIPKDLTSLDGKWTWRWGKKASAMSAFDLKDGRRLDGLGWQFKLDGFILKAILSKNLYTDLVLQPDGSWLGIEVPTGYNIILRRAKN